MKMRYLIILASILILPVLAYGVARALVNLMSINPGIGEVVGISLVVWAVLLIAPYLMLKSTFSNANAEDKDEKKLHMSDLPKDQPKTQIKYPNSH